MARPRLRSPEQPWIVRFVLGIYEFCASLRLAVILLVSAAVVLASATFVESKFGLRAVHFGIYGTWWFTLLNALLALNIFCAAMIRYPWKRYQTGFVITHLGLLTLMFGMLLSRRGGIDAQMPVAEDGTAWRAYEDSERFELAIEPLGAPRSDEPLQAEVIAVPFVGGPFNWEELDRLPALPWRLARVDRGVIYDRDGIRLEVLDYYSDSREVDAPQVTLALSTPAPLRQGADGRETAGPVNWVPVELSVNPAGRGYQNTRPFGIGSRQSVGGGQIVFWLAGSRDEVDAFLASAPQGPLGPQGQVVLWAGGTKFVVPVAERLGQGPFPLGETGYQAEVTAYYPTALLDQESHDDGLRLTRAAGDGPPQRPAVELVIRPAAAHEDAPADAPAAPASAAEAEGQRLVLFAGLPEVNQQAYRLGVFGSYWFDHGEKTSEQLLRGEGGSRIDVIEGPAGYLYYRYWNRREVVAAAPLPADGAPVDAFKMPIAQLQMKVDQHLPSPEPARKMVPLPFDPDQVAASARRAAKVRLTVDGRSEEFWIAGPPADLYERAPTPSEQRFVDGEGRRVALRLPLDEIDVGFRVRLRDFERKLDPGTSQPSHYSSVVDLIGREDDRVYQREMLITMNAPIDFSDPQSGRSYRLFQEAFRGPFAPGDPLHSRLFHGTRQDEEGFVSILTVNYDPGRGLKYLGCLLVVVGIVTMFYMRAYFFQPKRRSEAAAGGALSAPEPLEMVQG